MKLGFLAYSPFVLDVYYRALAETFDCWWAVTQRDTYQELVNRGYEKILFVEDTLVYQSQKAGNKLVSERPGDAERALMDKLDADAWISDQTNRLTHCKKVSPWIQTFHSLCYKKHTFYQPVEQYDLLLLPGEYHRDEFIKRLDFRVDDPRLNIVGWPRHDALINGAVEHHGPEIPASIKKKVLFAPTWGGFDKNMYSWGNHIFPRWHDDELAAFEYLCQTVQELDMELIIKLHHLSVGCVDARYHAIANKYQCHWVTKEHSNLQLDPNYYLTLADILISDMSGIIMDYLVLDKPIIYLDPDDACDAWFEASIDQTFRCGSVVQTLPELREALLLAKQRPDFYQKERERTRDAIFSYTDGASTHRAVQAISALLLGKSDDVTTSSGMQ